MIIYSLSFLAGISALQLFAQLPHEYFLYGLICLTPFFIFYRTSRWLGILLLGFCWVWLNALWVLEDRLPKSLEGENIIVRGYVASIPNTASGNRKRFIFEAEERKLGNDWQPFPLKINLSWYYTKEFIQPGQLWQLKLRLKRPHGMMNPGGFDYEKWIFRTGIDATGYVRKDQGNHLIKTDHFAFPLTTVRAYLATQLKEILPDNKVAGFIPALTIGLRQGIDQQQWDILRVTGTSHLMAISGLHIGLISGFVFLLVRRLGLSRMAPLMAILAALTYAALAGFSVPTQRAVIMVVMFLGAVSLRRHVNPFHTLASALFLILLIDPSSLLSAGLWMSFLALMIIFYLSLANQNKDPLWLRWVRLQVLLSCALVPVSLIFFQQASWVSPLANLIAIPWLSMVVVPISLIGISLISVNEELATIVLQVAVLAMDWIWVFLEYCADIPASQWLGQSPLMVLWPFIIVGLLLFLSPRAFPIRYLGFLILLPIALWKSDAPASGDVWVDMLDVGQGSAAVIRTQNHSLVFDTGAKYSDTYDMGRSVLIPFLVNQGLHKIDYLIISHGDNDHIGGAYSLLQSIAVDKVYSSVKEGLDWVSYEPCYQGEQWQWDGVLFSFIHPARNDRLSANDLSCVLRVEAANGDVILLTGDIERKAERRLLRKAPDLLRARVLIVPHHGSKTSSTEQFINAVDPEYALISSGYRNRFKHPNKAVVMRYKARGIVVVNSADSGAIQLRLNQSTGVLTVEKYRLLARRYWHD